MTFPPAGRPLARFSVLDLTTVRSGPTCTKILADFGADVVQVERPGGEGRERVFFDAADLHRNKRSIAVNLQEPRGVAVVKRLAARSDVVVENYRPDVKHRARRPAAEWVESLNAAGVACGPINTVDRVFADPQIRQADLVADVANATWGPHKVLALPVHLSRTPARVEHAAPMPGEHTREILTTLGYEAALDALVADGVIEQYKGETT